MLVLKKTGNLAAVLILEMKFGKKICIHFSKDSVKNVDIKTGNQEIYFQNKYLVRFCFFELYYAMFL